MKRKFLLPPEAASLLIELLSRRNAAPLWGHPPGTLLLARCRWERTAAGKLSAVLEFEPSGISWFTILAYPLCDFSPLARFSSVVIP